MKRKKTGATTPAPEEKISTMLYDLSTNVKHRHNRHVHISEALEDFLRNNTSQARRKVAK